jgi:hypothetical protein
MLKKTVEYLSKDWDTATKNLLAINRVRELHSPTQRLGFVPIRYDCINCNGFAYPCPTIKALDGDTDGQN